MNNHFAKRQLFQVGHYYQIDSFNPEYLDKTGLLISNSEGKLINWNGNGNEFHFTDIERLYSGKVNMGCYWYQNPKQGDYDEKTITAFSLFIDQANEIIDSVYKPKYYTRIGFRVQYILKKTALHVREKYIHMYDSCFSKITSYGSLESTAIGFSIRGPEINTQVNLNFAHRNTDNDINAPKEGLLFDLDYNVTLSKATKKEAFKKNGLLVQYIKENNTDLINKLAEEMGII